MAYYPTERIRSGIIIFLLVAAPFHAFFITWIRSSFSGNPLVDILSVWRELLIALIIFLAIVEHFLQKKRPHFDLLDWLIIFFAVYALLFFVLGSQPFAQKALGFRYDALPWLLFLAVRHSTWNDKEKYFKVALWSALIVMLFGIAQSLVVPQDFLSRFGYSIEQSVFSGSRAITGCPYLEHTSSICRAIATFGGPTRYGTYLLLILGLTLSAGKNLFRRGFYALLCAIALINIVLTYSRSVWIAAVVVFAIAAVWQLKKAINKRTVAVIVLIIMTAGAIFAALIFPTDSALKKIIFIRETSTGEHQALFIAGLQKVVEHPLGMGLGTVGPASIRFEKLLTENWYLQIALEMGIIGLILFLSVITVFSKKLLDPKYDGRARSLFLGLIGILVAAIFTHAFEETSTVMILATLAAIVTSPRQSSSQHRKS